MSRTYGDRKDSSDKIVTLKKKIKFLEREVEQLRKALNKTMQALAQYRKPAPPPEPEEKRIACDQCGKGTFDAFKLNVSNKERTYLTCNICGHRKQTTK